MVGYLIQASGISLEEAERRYLEAEEAFRRIQSNYSGVLGLFPIDFRAEHLEEITQHVYTLLSISLEDSVQYQCANAPLAHAMTLQDTLLSRSTTLAYEMVGYLARFPNTGVRFGGYMQD